MSAPQDPPDPVDEMVAALRSAMGALDLTLWSASGAHVFNGATALDDLARSLLARRVLAPSMVSAEAGTLDEAWKAAEAALPEGWRFGSLRAAVAFDGYVTSVVGWTATAHEATGIGRSDPVEGYAVTPAAALLALATALRAVPA